MQHQESEFLGEGGLPLYYQVWRPEVPPVASLIIVHGLSEHSSRYTNLVNNLVPNGVTVYTFDHRGHGRSAENLVAHVNDWSEYRGDVRAFVELVTTLESNAPLFLLGHSMGGLITANYVLHHPRGLHGVILSAPPLGDVGVSPLLRLLGRVVSAIKPDMVFKSGLELSGISRDPAVLEAYNNDPLIHGKITARWSVEFFKAIEWTRNHAATFEPPVLIIHGDADELVPIAGSRAFFDNIHQSDKHYITYEGGYHESLSDIHYEQVVGDIRNWLMARV
ncbi:MAG: alpha/beta hydrolase [Proteobacteria bacterium]|nr:alpha/beta hydrolase [Pseudomonadota bacterium]